MITFIKIVITGIENWSPDMISVAFERKFDEKKDEIPPGICRPLIHQIIQYWGVDGDTKNTKMVITRVIWGPPWPEFGMYLTTILSNIFLSPKDPNFN